MSVEPGDKTQEIIRRRAYEIWEREGRVGDPLDHWFRAKWELDALRDHELERDQHPSSKDPREPGTQQGSG